MKNKKNNSSWKRNILALLMGIIVCFTMTFNSDAALSVGGNNISPATKVYYNSQQVYRIYYDGNLVWQYGLTVVFHSAAGDYTMLVTDDAKIASFNPNNEYSVAGKDENSTFYGWSKGSKATATSGKAGAEALTADETHYYAMYVHKHTGNTSTKGGCHTKEKKGAEKTKECGAEIVTHETREDPNNPGGHIEWWQCSEGHWGHGDWYVFQAGGGKCGAIVGSGEYEPSTWELDCGKTEGSTIETW